jgi:hypothetical protein
MPAEVVELYQETPVRWKIHIVPEPVAQRRRTSCPMSRRGIGRRTNAIFEADGRVRRPALPPLATPLTISPLDRRNTKIMPCNADITAQPARVGPIEAPEDYPHISPYQGVLP